MILHLAMLGFAIMWGVLGFLAPAESIQRHSCLIQGSVWMVGANVITVLS